jgi:hypothetical protein
VALIGECFQMKPKFRIYVVSDLPVNLKEMISEVHAQAILQSRGRGDSPDRPGLGIRKESAHRGAPGKSDKGAQTHRKS